MPPQKRGRRHDRVQFPQCLAPDCLRFPRKERSLGVGETNALAAQLLLQEAILGLEEFNDNELVAMDPA
jgi:hypothetical protein